jgi:hypothetical protein
MDMKEAESKVLAEALKWFLKVLRLEGLQTHEKGLFEAVAVLRREIEAAKRMPALPPLPPPPEDLEALSSGDTLKDFPATPEDEWGYRNYDELTTFPVPMCEYERMVVDLADGNEKDPHEDS